MTVINWAEIYNRLEHVNKAIECGFKRTAEECTGIIKKRTEIFAREAEIRSGEGEYLEVVEFSLAHERYAIQTDYVREIIVLHELISIPCTPSYVSGIVNLRGDIISVIDLKRFFDLPENGLSDLNKVIILYYEDMVFGILADAITGVRNILLTELETTLPTLTEVRAEYLKGVTKEHVVILNAERLLTDKRIIVDEKVEL